MERPIDIVEQGIYIEPNVFNNDSEYELFHSYLESQKYIIWLESELKKIRVADVSGRSELLIEFAKFIQKHKNEGLDYDCIEREVTDFLNQ